MGDNDILSNGIEYFYQVTIIVDITGKEILNAILPKKFHDVSTYSADIFFFFQKAEAVQIIHTDIKMNHKLY